MRVYRHISVDYKSTVLRKNCGGSPLEREKREINYPQKIPVSAGALHHLTRTRLARIGYVGQHYGPHSLRHACATYLMACRLSLKEIGDHLGHQSPEATRTYAKVDLQGLRDVAQFDMGEME